MNIMPNEMNFGTSIAEKLRLPKNSIMLFMTFAIKLDTLKSISVIGGKTGFIINAITEIESNKVIKYEIIRFVITETIEISP